MYLRACAYGAFCSGRARSGSGAGSAHAGSGCQSAAPSPSCRFSCSLPLPRFPVLLDAGLGGGIRAAANNVADLLATACRNHARALFILQRIERRANHVVGVRRAERLGNHVLNAERLKHGAHRATGDDARAGRGCAENDAARTMATINIVMQCPAFAKRNADHRALCGFGRLADGFRHFTRLAMSEADAALLIAHHDKRGKAETTATLHDLGDAVDVNQLVHKLAIALVPIPVSVFLTCHSQFPLEVETAFAGAFGERLDAPMIDVTTAIEDDIRNTGLLRAFGNQLADGG